MLGWIIPRASCVGNSFQLAFADFVNTSAALADAKASISGVSHLLALVTLDIAPASELVMTSGLAVAASDGCARRVARLRIPGFGRVDIRSSGLGVRLV